jgi:hypothetical protein
MSAEPKRVELTEAERDALDVGGMFPTEYGWQHPEKWFRKTQVSLFERVARIVAAREAAARREALQEAIEDIRERRRRFAGLGCDEQYLLAMDDCFGLVNNRLSAVLAEPERDEEGGND